LLGQYYLDRNQLNEAVQALNDALGLKIEGEGTAVSRHQSTLHQLRSQAYRRQKQYEPAFQDIQEAIILAQQIGDDKLVAYYRQERDIVENHAGRKSGRAPV
jgi:tetratricopeptide (TPR) repeat protein